MKARPTAPKRPKAPLTDEQKLAAAASSPMAKGLSGMVTLLSQLRDAAGELMDPVKRVCYPPLATAHRHAQKQALRISDPIHRVCYEPLRGHWERKYKERYPKHANSIFILDLILAVIISALVVAIVFSPEFLPTADPNVLTVHVHAPSSSTSGNLTSIAIEVANLSTKEALPCTILTIDAPPSFADAGVTLSGDGPAVVADPSCQPTDVAPGSVAVPLPALGVGMARTATVSGVPYAPTGSVVEIPARLSYWTTGKTEPVIVPFHISLPVSSTAAGMDIAVPERILRGAVTAITLSYHNDSSRTVPDAAVRFAPPADFVTTGSAPRAASAGTWRLGDLVPDARGTIVVYGYLRSARERASAAAFEANLLMNASGETPIVTSAMRVNADTLSTGLTLTQNLGGVTAADFLRPGDDITVRLTVRNDGDRIFANGSLRFLFTDALFDPETDYGTAPVTGFDVPGLKHIAPGDTVTVTTSLHVREKITPTLMENLGTDTALASFSAVLLAETLPTDASGTTVGENVVIDTPPVDVPIATALHLQAAGIYFTKDGDQIGRGPLPPTVGATTRYRIVVRIDNAQTPVEDATFEAFLAEGVEWTGKFSITHGEAVDYFPSTRRITWKIPSVDAFTEEHSTSPGASFEVALTPTAKQAGTIPTLLTGLSVSGKDTATGTRITDRVGDITTRLPFDFDDTRSKVTVP
jgi:hypothetical protein